MSPWARLAGAALLLVALAGGRRDGYGAEGATPAPTATPAATPGALSDEVCLDFARKIEAAVAARDKKAVAESFSLDALLTRAQGDLRLPVETMLAFRDELVRQGQTRGLITTTGSESSYKFLRLRRTAGELHALFRRLDDHGLAYHELLLQPGTNGDVQIADMYFWAGGEWLSQVYRRGLAAVAAQAGTGKADRKQRQYFQALLKFQQMAEHTAAGRSADALAVYRELPAAIQRDKSALMLRLGAARKLDEQTGQEQEVLAALADIQKYFPDDPGFDLLLTDLYLARKQYDRAFECTERLDQAVGGDPYQNVCRGAVRLAQGRQAEARQLFQQALEQEPTLLPAYQALLTLSLNEQNYAETVRVLELLQEKCEISFPGLRDDPRYAGFARSPEGQKWLAGQPDLDDISTVPVAPKKPATPSTPPRSAPH